MNNDDYKSDSDYIDVVAEEKKEVRDEIIKTVIKIVGSILIFALICFLGYKGVMLALNKVQESGFLEDDGTVNTDDGVTPDDSSSSSGSSGSSDDGGVVGEEDNPAVSEGCNGVFEGTKDGVEYVYILYDDGNFSSSIGDSAKVGTFTINDNQVTFDSEGNKETYRIDKKCTYLMVNNIKLIKK